MAMPTETGSVTLGEPRSRTDLVLEMIALRHQIAVLKRSRTRRVHRVKHFCRRDNYFCRS
jgi:hypothetical protein